MESFNGRLAVVTGGGTGMGRELVVQLAADGAHVAMCDVNPATMDETAARARDGAPEGTRITTHACDVSSEADVLRFRDEVVAQHETDHINLLFNNAGIGAGGSFVAGDRDEWERTFAVCWGGVYNCARAFVPLLVASDDGYLINTSSVNGFWASIGPGIPHTAYSSAKFAVKGFSEALIEDFRMNAPHVKVAVVMPGHIGTDIVLNTRRILGNEAEQMSAQDVAASRKVMAARGFPSDSMSDDDIRNLMRMMGEMFRDNAPDDGRPGRHRHPRRRAGGEVAHTRRRRRPRPRRSRAGRPRGGVRPGRAEPRHHRGGAGRRGGCRRLTPGFSSRRPRSRQRACCRRSSSVPWRSRSGGTSTSTRAVSASPSPCSSRRRRWRRRRWDGSPSGGDRCARCGSPRSCPAAPAWPPRQWRASLPTLLAPIAVGGASNALCQPAANLMIARALPPSRQGLAFAVKQSAIPMSTLLAGAAVPLVAQTIGWRWGFVIAAALVLLAGSCVPAVGALGGSGPAAGERGTPDVPFRIMTMLAVGIGFGAAAGGTLGSFLVSAAVDGGLSEGSAGWLLTAGSVAGIATRLLAGVRADRRDGGHLRVVAWMLAAGAAVFVVLSVHSPWAYAAAGPLGFCTAWAWPGLFNLAVVRANPSRPAAATGITQTGTYIGAVSGPLLFGVLASRASFTAAWLTASVFAIIGAVAMTEARRRLRAWRANAVPPVDPVPA